MASETPGAMRHEYTEWIARNQVVENVGVLFFEVGWDIHGALRGDRVIGSNRASNENVHKFRFNGVGEGQCP